MKLRQFISYSTLRNIDYLRLTNPYACKCLFDWPRKFLLPRLGYERYVSTPIRLDKCILVFFAGFFFCFVLQAYFALRAGHIGILDSNFGATRSSDGEQLRVMFFDDLSGLVSYALISPLYLVAGIGFVASAHSLDRRMARMGDGYGFKHDESVAPGISGSLATLALVAPAIFIHAAFSSDIHAVPAELYWFHGDTQLSRLEYNGYFYLSINSLLNLFVIYVTIFYISLFKWAGILTQVVRSYDASEVTKGDVFENEGSQLRELLAPFTEAVLWAKGFAVLLAFSVFLWAQSSASGTALGDVNHSSAAFQLTRKVFEIYVIMTIWVVSMPRYRVQYEIFKLRRRQGIHEQIDIRMPWTIGYSVFLDFTFILFFSFTILEASDVLQVLEQEFT